MDSVYIHIPFCESICSYCDFCKVLYKRKWVRDYLESLDKEIEDVYNGEEIKTLYIGGGTPSRLEEEDITTLFKIIKRLNLSKLEEFTYECNINDIDSNLLNILKLNGVNRLSIGIESFNKKKLKFMNRYCTYPEVKNKIKLCREFGFDNINIDLIYGIPKETLHILQDDLKKIISLNPEHISTYSLIIEDNTFIKDITPIDSDIDFEMYSKVVNYLINNGYKHYEISNFAKEGYESKHNTNYWLNNNYYGFGLGAHGYIGNVRYENTRSLTKYIDGFYRLKEEVLSINDDMDNFVMLAFRLIDGFSLQYFFNKYHVNFQEQYDIKDLIKEKKLIYKDGYIKINPKYLYVENEILIKII